MGRSIRASEQGLARIDQARQRLGWTKTSTARWWQDAHTSRATLRRFWRRERIQNPAFMAICQTVGVEDWEAIADFSSPDLSVEKQKSEGEQGGKDPKLKTQNFSYGDATQTKLPHSPTPPRSHAPTPPLPHAPTPPLPHAPLIDWGHAPDIDLFYDRASELAKLEQWIVRDRAKLIHIGGLGGIGKTTLAVALAEQLQTEFEGIIWRSLHGLTSFDAVMDELTDIPCDTLLQKLQQLLSKISQNRLLLILDVSEPSEDFWDILVKLTSARHQSCVVVICRDLLPITFQSLSRTQFMILEGLSTDAAVQLLQHCGCEGTLNQIKALARLYSHNPLALKLVSATIQTVFGGRIAPFLEQDSIVLPAPILLPLSQQFEDLTPLEQSLMFWLAIWQEPIALCRLQTHHLHPRPVLVMAALSKLVERSLITRHFLTDEPSFGLQPMVMAFVMDELVDAMIEEIKQAQQQRSIEPFVLLRSHCLSRPGTDDILGDRVLLQLRKSYTQGTLDVSEMLEEWMAIAQTHSSHANGYLMVNLKALKSMGGNYA